MAGLGGVPFNFENADDRHVQTRPKRASTANEKAVMNFAAALRDGRVSPEMLAADFVLLPVDIQIQLSRFVFALLGHWAEFDAPNTHPLAHVYDTAKKMINRLFG